MSGSFALAVHAGAAKMCASYGCSSGQISSPSSWETASETIDSEKGRQGVRGHCSRSRWQKHRAGNPVRLVTCMSQAAGSYCSEALSFCRGSRCQHGISSGHRGSFEFVVGVFLPSHIGKYGYNSGIHSQTLGTETALPGFIQILQ